MESQRQVRVMIVEDEQMARRALGMLLSARGYRVELAESAEHALDLLRQRTRPDVVLVDVDLPGMSGLELLERVKRLAPDVIPVLVTGADRETVWPATRRGVPYLRKPVDFNRLVSVIDRTTDRS